MPRCAPACVCAAVCCVLVPACDGRGGCDSDGTAVRRAQGKSKVDAKGKVKIPDLSEETYDDLEMTVTLEEESDAKRALKEAVRLKGAPLIRNACMAFVKELKVPASPAPCLSARPHAPARLLVARRLHTGLRRLPPTTAPPPRSQRATTAPPRRPHHAPPPPFLPSLAV